MSPYAAFKRDHRVSALSKEELFNLAYEQGLAASAAVASAEALLEQVADIVSKVYRCGSDLEHDDAARLLKKIYRHNPTLVTCAYCRKYINMR